MTKLITFCLIVFPLMSYSQRSIVFSTGFTSTQVNPFERFQQTVSSRARAIRGWEYQAAILYEFMDNVSLDFRLGYNQHEGSIYYNYQSGVNERYITEGLATGGYLGSMLGFVISKGDKFKFYYGGGVYAGIKLRGTFTGVEKYVSGNQDNTFNLVDEPLEYYRSTAFGLYPTGALSYRIIPALDFILRADFIYFFQAKNIIFSDTGSVNELNFLLGLKWNLRSSDKELDDE